MSSSSKSPEKSPQHNVEQKELDTKNYTQNNFFYTKLETQCVRGRDRDDFQEERREQGLGGECGITWGTGLPVSCCEQWLPWVCSHRDNLLSCIFVTCAFS